MVNLNTITERLAPELADMNKIIQQSLATDNDLMNRVVTSYLRTKGKQIRPILVILSAKMLGEINSDVLYASAALEMLHNASLIHDDVVDETSTRRGESTINALWGNHIAVLVGDFFVSNALAAGIATGHLSIISALSELGKELSIGEIDQICNAQDHNFNYESYYSTIRKKTASLFMNCVRMGGEAVGASPEEISPLVEYAELLGLCFQIKDDIFDYFEDKRIGKPTGNDLREGKTTLPLLYALTNAPTFESEHMKSIIRSGNICSNDIRVLTSFTKKYGGIEYAYSEMRKMQTRANNIIAHYPESEPKSSFIDIFDFIISRHN